MFLFSCLILSCLWSSASCAVDKIVKDKVQSGITIASNDASLVEIFDWAVHNSNRYVGSDSDPVGPWYEAALPGRQAFCMRDVSHQCIGEEINGHGRQNANIMGKFVENISPSKDYCSYWEIDRYNRPSSADYVSDKDFWYNLNANFDVMNACYRLYLWTGNKQYIDNPQFERFFRLTANEYIDKWQLQADKIMSRPDVMNEDNALASPKFKGYRGLPSYEESVRGLTVTGDLIATIYRGLKSYAAILSLRGDNASAKQYEEKAEGYFNLYNNKWWNAATGNYYAYKLTDGQLHEGGNNIFPVWFGIVADKGRINSLLKIMASKETNVESMSYYPMTFYRYGWNDEGYRYLKELFTNKRRDYPEVASGVIEGVVSGLAGVSANAVTNTITTIPRLTSGTQWVSIDDIPVFSGKVSVRHNSAKESTLLNSGSKDIVWRAAFQGSYDKINGQKANQTTDAIGNVISYIDIVCKSGEKATAKVENADYWHLNSKGGITWVNDGRAHDDHIEMSGKQVSVVLRYGIGVNGGFHCNYGMVWPMLRTIPNNTHASLMRHLDWNALDAVNLNNQPLPSEHVDSIEINGMLTVYSHFGGLSLVRTISPSTSEPAVVEQFTFTNNRQRPVSIGIDDKAIKATTDAKEGVTGSYVLEQALQSAGVHKVGGGESFTFTSVIYGRRQSESMPKLDVAKELQDRQQLVSQLQDQLILKTPDPVLNRMFAFSKVRACESIYETKAGPMHGPGGEAYYAAIWANDQAEYANAFFPFTGYDYAVKSAMVSWKLFEKWKPKDWSPIPSSIIAEGDDIWNGAGDRGDAAMIAYGASRFALETGSAETARQLWPLITWCLEYCHRQLNDSGVVRSNSDELEGRFPAGTANLNTSCLYYDALISASYLARDLRIGGEKTYIRQAEALRKAIDSYFHADVQGFDTYRYYAGNTLLRSWICVPLAMGIMDHAKGTLDALFSPKLWTDNGLLTQQGDKTFWDRSTLYALRGAFAAGETQRALSYLEKYSHTRLLGDHVPYAIEAWPEGNQRHLSAESALYARIFTEGVFGIRPTGLHQFSVAPRLPEGWDNMSLHRVHLCGKVFDLDVTRKEGRVEVKITSNGKVQAKSFTGKALDFKL